MTTNKSLLIGEWEFIKAERHNGNEWEPMGHTDGMSWMFHPDFIGEQKAIGTIIETAPQVDPSRLNYLFSDTDNLLRIEVYTDLKTRILDETDIYKLEKVTHATTYTTIILSLINQLGYPPPYLRYTLRQSKK